MKFKPHKYQLHGSDHIVDNNNAGLFLGMGLGKTSTTLHAIHRLMYDRFEISSSLIVAPKKVVENVWQQERDKWDCFKHLTIVPIVGNPRQRKEAIAKKADIHLVSRDNVAWLLAYLGGAFPWDLFVIDELSSFKSAKSNRFKAIKVILPRAKRRVGLTGSPMPNGLPDLWSQLYFLDMGERLGRTLGEYRNKYLVPAKTNGHIVYKYKVKRPDKDDRAILGEDFYSKLIFDKISDICISMEAKDYLDLPGRVDRTIDIELTKQEYAKYEQFEEELVLDLEGEEITALNAGTLVGKLLQFASGAVYNSEKVAREVHRQKIDRLDELLDTATGPMLVGYWFKHSEERILRYLKKYKPVVLRTPEDMKRWNRGLVDLALLHPASGGHGLNLQSGGNLLTWFDLPNYSSELYEQFIARIDRQGQELTVINNHLVAKKTMDIEVMRALNGKIANQKSLINAVKAIINKYK